MNIDELVEETAASGIKVIVIDDETDFDNLPPFASLFPQVKGE